MSIRKLWLNALYHHRDTLFHAQRAEHGQPLRRKCLVEFDDIHLDYRHSKLLQQFLYRWRWADGIASCLYLIARQRQAVPDVKAVLATPPLQAVWHCL